MPRVIYARDDGSRPVSARFTAIIEARGRRLALLSEALAPCMAGRSDWVVDLADVIELPTRLADMPDCFLAPATGHC